MADEELQLDVNQPKGSKMTIILLIVLIVLVLVMGAVGAWYFLSKGDTSGAEAGSENAAKVVKEPLHYLTLVPEFVVNFGPDSKVRYLQIDIQVSSRDEKALATMQTYMPVIRNDVLVLLSGQSFDDLKSSEGKTALQAKILNTLNSILNSVANEKNQGEKKDVPAVTENKDAGEDKATENSVVEGPIENIYFTSFIMQ